MATPSPEVSGLTAALRAALPQEYQQSAPAFADVLTAAVRGEITAEQAAMRLTEDQRLAETVRRLAGTRVSGGAGVVSFGAGSQTGDVTISGVAGRDIVINVAQTGGLAGRRFWLIAGGIVAVAALVVAVLLQGMGATQERIRLTRSAIAADVFTNLSNLDAQLLFVDQTLALAPSATASGDVRQRIGESQIESLRASLTSRPLRDDQGAAYAQTLISSGADAADVEAFYQNLGFTRDASESLLASMAELVRLGQANQDRIAFAQQVVTLDARRLTTFAAISHLSGLKVLARSGVTHEQAQQQFRDLLKLEPRALPSETELDKLLVARTNELAALALERLRLASQSLDSLAAEQQVAPTDTAAEVAAKAIALRRTGEPEVAAAIFTYYGERFAAEDPTAARYGQVGMAFAQQAATLNLAGGAYVFQVQAGSPAAKAGLLEGDVIVALNGRPTETNVALTDALGALPAGQAAALTILRLRTDQSFERTELVVKERPLGVGLMPI